MELPICKLQPVSQEGRSSQLWQEITSPCTYFFPLKQFKKSWELKERLGQVHLVGCVRRNRPYAKVWGLRVRGSMEQRGYWGRGRSGEKSIFLNDLMKEAGVQIGQLFQKILPCIFTKFHLIPMTSCFDFPLWKCPKHGKLSNKRINTQASISPYQCVFLYSGLLSFLTNSSQCLLLTFQNEDPSEIQSDLNIIMRNSRKQLLYNFKVK